MKMKTCLDAFAAGKADSQTYRRNKGAHKLAERLCQWKDYEQEVSRIAAAVKHPALRRRLNSCTFQDKHVWLNRILKTIAYELSESIIPSFKALNGDGMTQTQIDQDLPYVERRCQEILQELERARQTIKGRIRDEYERMRHGDSVVGDALARAREMLEEIVDLTPAGIQRDIHRTVEEVI